MLRKLKDSELALTRGIANKQAPLCLCRRRMELRERRPQQELSRDALQEAIEAEEKILCTSREDLQQLVEATRDLVPGLEQVKQELLEDCYEKRRSGHIDHL